MTGIAESTLTNIGSIPPASTVQGPTPLPSLPGMPMNQPQPYIPVMPSYTQPPQNVFPPNVSQQSTLISNNVPVSNYLPQNQNYNVPPNSTANMPPYNMPVMTSLSLHGMPPITVSATLPATAFEGLSQSTINQSQMTS